MSHQQTDVDIDDRIGTPADDEINVRICFPGRSNNRVSCNILCLLVLGCFIFTCGITSCMILFHSDTYRNLDNEHDAILPRQTWTLTDLGYSKRFYGWVDVQRQGVPNDYARYVGPTHDCPFVWLSIALAGSTDQYTSPGLYEEHSGIVIRTLVKPRQKILEIDNLGLPYYFKGWVDVQNQGIPNDYAYYVAPTEDIPVLWLTVALAGSSEKRTCAGLYTEKYGVVKPSWIKKYYDENATVSCEYWFRLLRPTLLGYDSHDPSVIQNHSISAYNRQKIITKMSNTTHSVRILMWRQLLSGDNEILISGRTTASSSNTLIVFHVFPFVGALAAVLSRFLYFLID